MRYIIQAKKNNEDYILCYRVNTPVLINMNDIDISDWGQVIVADGVNAAQSLINLIVKQFNKDKRFYIKKVDSLNFPYKISNKRAFKLDIENVYLYNIKFKNTLKLTDIEKELETKTFRQINKKYKKYKKTNNIVS